MKNIKPNRILVILIGMIILLTLVFGNLKVNATEDKIYVALSRVIPDTTFGYAIGDPTVSTGDGKTIWNLVSYTDNTFTTTNDFSKSNLYCLKAGAGFYNENGQSDANAKKTYTRLCSISDKEIMSASTHKYVKELADGENYNKVRWLLDNMFVKGESTEQDKKKILYEAGIAQVSEEGEPIIDGTGNYYYWADGEYDYYESDADIGTVAKGGYTTLLTDEDLVAMQQAAIWYFTNGDNVAYNRYANKNWTFVTEDSSKDIKGTYQTMSTSYASREEQSRIVYKYLIDAAKKNASNYDSVITNKEVPVTITKDNAKIVEKNEKYIVGPIKIEKNNSIAYDITAKVSNESDTEISDYKYVNAEGKEISNFDINSYAGDFYISVPAYEARTVKVDFDMSYEKRDAYIYVEEGATEDQPIVIPETEKKNIKLQFELNPDLTQISVEKIWNDNNNADNVRPTEIKVQLYKNGIAEGSAIILNQENDWKYTWNNLPKYNEEETNDGTSNGTSNGTGNGTSNGTGNGTSNGTGNGTGNETVNRTEIEYTVKELNSNNVAVENNGKFDINYTATYDTISTVDTTKITNTYNEKPEFDLKLIKRIVAVNGKEEKERLLNVDVSKLNKNGVTTAEYKMEKDPVLVKNGDIVTYTFRIYNEGDIDGYASEITEDIPEGLDFIWSDKEGEDLKNDTTLTEAEKNAIEFNQSMLWKYTDTGLKTISTTYLSKNVSEDNLIKAFDKENQKIDYREVSVMLKVTAKNTFDGIIRNEAEISEDEDKDGNSIDDRDSDTEKWGKENSDTYYDEDKKWSVYKEDDEDYDNIKLQYFDLALRKFITAVEDEPVTSRIPVVTYKDGKIVYTHPKDPLTVHVGDVVTYTIRVFNEGKVDGYAEEVTDDIPEYLEYLPDNKTNKEYRWVMKDKEGKEVTDVSKANKVTTDYLSSKQEEESKRDNLLKSFDSNSEINEKNPDYRDLKIAFKVKDPNSNTYIITNHAQISEDSDDDIDSTPGKWVEGEDDQDIENVKVQYFDLALRKYVTQAIVIENGKQTVTNTGHKAEDDPEQIVKVELHRKKLSSVVVKFRYKIKITNEGDIEGYAKEITDYIPAGLKFVAEDNPDWKDEGNNVISTRQLENTLLQPGDSTEVEVLLTWINGADNTGLKINTAEISEDWNKPGIPDRDSTPDNKKPGEDDIDDAPVMLSIETGQARIYYALGSVVLAILAGGIFLIKKYVL